MQLFLAQAALDSTAMMRDSEHGAYLGKSFQKRENVEKWRRKGRNYDYLIQFMDTVNNISWAPPRCPL